MKVLFDRENKRLVCINQKATPDFWEKHWDNQDFSQTLLQGRDNRFILKTLQKYIPDGKGKIIEGGCGIGDKVYAMFCHGYDVVGVDYAKQTVDKAKEIIPDLPVLEADVRKMPFDDNYFEGYWSIGVIEHFYSGYDEIIQEMVRVVKPGGYVFMSFPYMSSLRRLKAYLNLYPTWDKEAEEEHVDQFYQFMLDHKKVASDMSEAGFDAIEDRPVDGIKGLKDEIGLIKPFLRVLLNHKKSILAKGLLFIIGKTSRTLNSGHSVFLVFKKRPEKRNVLNL